MNSQDLHNLQEAYSQVYELDEKIATPPSWYNMRRKLDPEKRRLRRSRDFYTYGGENQDPDERTISTSKGEGGITKNPKKLRKQKAMGEFGEQIDLYDIILSHLLDEGYAETQEQAEVIMVNMSEDWRESIVDVYGLDEEITPEKRKQFKKILSVRQSNQETYFGKKRPRKRATPPQPGADYYRQGMTPDDRYNRRDIAREENPERPEGKGGITKNPKKLRKQKAMGEHG